MSELNIILLALLCAGALTVVGLFFWGVNKRIKENPRILAEIALIDRARELGLDQNGPEIEDVRKRLDAKFAEIEHE